ncbi:hypothetical protein EXS72_02815 [Candidatus Pacearchaeota archaeon]|nr:hypothetical protein [Candidatus Pacearchaeota archaeon]
MTFFRKGDTRTIWIFAVLALIILVISLTGLWKRFDSLIFAANLLGFEKDVTPLGASIIGVNLNKGDLRYFTGETWKVIDVDKSSKFVLGDYNFNPQSVKEAFWNFQTRPERRPNVLSLEINRWRYLRATFSGNAWLTSLVVHSLVKSGYSGRDMLHPWNFESSKYPLVFQKVNDWSNQIYEGNSCEKFIPLELNIEDNSNSPQKSIKKYTVRKIDEYIFVDLENPVSEGDIQKWDNIYCFEQNYIEFKDFYRRDWKNNATVEISWSNKWVLFDIAQKVSWIPGKGWTPSIKKMYHLNFWQKLKITEGDLQKMNYNFEAGFQQLVIKNGVLETNNADFFDSDDSEKGEVLVNGKSVNIDFLKGSGVWDGSEEDMLKFEYAFFDEYNKYLVSPGDYYYFETFDKFQGYISDVNQKLNLKKHLTSSGTDVFTGIYRQKSSLYYDFKSPTEPEGFVSYLIGDISDSDVYIIERIPSFEEFSLLNINPPDLYNYNLFVEGLNSLKNKPIRLKRFVISK